MRGYVRDFHSNIPDSEAKRFESYIVSLIFIVATSERWRDFTLFTDDDFLENTTVFYKMWFLMVTTMLVRFKYYHAWIFADAICNNSGIGFNGYDKNGEPKWDLASNVDVYGFEVNFSKWIRLF